MKCILYTLFFIGVHGASIEPQPNGVGGSIAVESRLASKADNGGNVSFPAYNESSIQSSSNGSELGGALIENDSSPNQIYNLHYYDPLLENDYDDSNEDNSAYGEGFADKVEEEIGEAARKIVEIIRGIIGWKYPDVIKPDSSLT